MDINDCLDNTSQQDDNEDEGPLSLEQLSKGVRPFEKIQSSVSNALIVETDGQNEFDNKMDKYLLGSSLPPDYAAASQAQQFENNDDKNSLNSDLTSQKSHAISHQQRSMPTFLNQLHGSVEQRGFGMNRDQIKQMK